MENRPNEQGSVELNQFQKLKVQDLYIRKLNLWLDELSWENEKRERIIEMKDEEILVMSKRIMDLESELNDLKKKLESKGGKKYLVRSGVFPR